MVPNWFVNVSSPIVGISKTNFVLGTFLGLMPANIIHLKTGMVLKDASKIGLDLYVYFLNKNIIFLIILGFLSLIPIIMNKKPIKG
jgi:hypothetical protein